jgi:hypothetical protein
MNKALVTVHIGITILPVAENIVKMFVQSTRVGTLPLGYISSVRKSDVRKYIYSQISK